MSSTRHDHSAINQEVGVRPLSGEIGWMIRHLNDRAAFERYLMAAGITEETVDAYNEAFERYHTEA